MRSHCQSWKLESSKRKSRGALLISSIIYSEVSWGLIIIKMLESVNQFDKRLSQRIHKMNLGMFELPVLLFGVMFNDYYMWQPILMFGFTMLFEVYCVNRKIKFLRTFYWTCVIIVVGVTVGLVTSFLKKHCKRKRPEPLNTNWLMNLRKKQTNNALPSGDTA